MQRQDELADMVNTTGAYYTNLLPEADALKLTQRTVQELRKNGGWEYINKLHEERVNAHYLARHADGVPFHLYLTRKIDRPDLTGLKIRVTPIISAAVPLDRGAEMFDRLYAKEPNLTKVILNP